MCVLHEEIRRPLHLVADSLTTRLSYRPEFKVLGSIVGAIAVLVMYALAASKSATDHLAHHDYVLCYATAAVLASVRVAVPNDHSIAVTSDVTVAVCGMLPSALQRISVTLLPLVVRIAQAFRVASPFASSDRAEHAIHAMFDRDMRERISVAFDSGPMRGAVSTTPTLFIATSDETSGDVIGSVDHCHIIAK